MNIINTKIVIKILSLCFLIFISGNLKANTKVIGLVINESKLEDVNKLYATENDGDNGYLINPKEIPIKGANEVFVTIFNGYVKVIGFEFNDSKYPYLNELLKSKYKLVSEKGEYPFPAISTFENDGDMIFLKKDIGNKVALIYADKEYNIQVNKSVKERERKERDSDFDHL